MKSLNVIGAGRVGRSLARLWTETRTLVVQDVLDGSLDGARAAVAFVGDGSAVADVDSMRAADVWMLATPDRRIVASSKSVAASGLLRAGDVVFHCSGSMSSADLASARARGAQVASIHPLKSFADAADAVRTFAGTYCAVEGDSAAVQLLRAAFESIGGRVSQIEPELKTIYHAASVIVCNYLNALLETGLRCYEKAGLSRDAATSMMQPLVRETLENIFSRGTAAALTGPIARGDDPVVARHVASLSAWDPDVTSVYKALGSITIALAHAQGEAEPDALARIESLLTSICSGDGR